MFQIFPSPTMGAFASQQYSWTPAAQGEEQGGNKEEQRQPFPDFSFQTTAPKSEEAVRMTTTFQPPVAPASLVRSAPIVYCHAREVSRLTLSKKKRYYWHNILSISFSTKIITVFKYLSYFNLFLY
jgi:hypothetical protein